MHYIVLAEFKCYLPVMEAGSVFKRFISILFHILCGKQVGVHLLEVLVTQKKSNQFATHSAGCVH